MWMDGKRLGVVALAAGLAAGVAGHANAAEKLVFASYISEAFTSSKADIWFMDEVEKRSNGEITFERYFSGSLLSGTDLYPGLMQSAADIVAGVPAAYNRNDFPLSNVSLPFITESPIASGLAFTELMQNSEALRAEYEKFNAKHLYSRSNPENVAWLSTPIRTVEDFQGKKIRAVLTIANAVEQLGATSVSMAMAEAVDALDRGMIDGFTAVPFDASFSVGLDETSKYVSDFGRFGASMITQVSFNLNRWNSLSEEHRALISQVADEAAEYFTAVLLPEAMAESVDKLCKEMSSGKIETIVFSADEAAKVNEKARQAVHDEWVSWAAQRAAGVDTRAMLDSYIELVGKYEAETSYTSGLDAAVAQCGS